MCIDIDMPPGASPPPTCSVNVDVPLRLGPSLARIGSAYGWGLLAKAANANGSVRRGLASGAELVAAENGLSLRFAMTGRSLRETQMRLRRFERCADRWQLAAAGLLRDVLRQMERADIEAVAA